VHIRHARQEDAGFLAWVMLASSRGPVPRGMWDLIIGADDAGCLEYLRRLALSEPRSLCHFERFWVAEVAGQPAAALCTFSLADNPWGAVGQAKAAVQRDLGWSHADVTASERRALPLWVCALPDIGADWQVEFVATRPEHRRQGLVQALIDRALLEGRAVGSRLAQITVFVGNDPAIAAYQKAGFTVNDERRCPQVEALLGTPGFARLTRSL
jgi:ribosomal protein S18 acetylase RimI-like enzyme